MRNGRPMGRPRDLGTRVLVAALAAPPSQVAHNSHGGEGIRRTSTYARGMPSPRRNRGRAVRRVGIMGGTFDPIHYGHLVAASEVASRFLLDEVVFVPTGQPWQKAQP